MMSTMYKYIRNYVAPNYQCTEPSSHYRVYIHKDIACVTTDTRVKLTIFKHGGTTLRVQTAKSPAYNGKTVLAYLSPLYVPCYSWQLNPALHGLNYF